MHLGVGGLKNNTNILCLFAAKTKTFVEIQTYSYNNRRQAQAYAFQHSLQEQQPTENAFHPF